MSIGPDLSSLLGGQQQQGVPPPSITIPGDQQGSGGSESEPLDILRQMIQLAQQYLEVEPDEEDKATMAQLHAKLQQYLAKDQADTQKAMGGDASIARVLRKAG